MPVLIVKFNTCIYYSRLYVYVCMYLYILSFISFRHHCNIPESHCNIIQVNQTPLLHACTVLIYIIYCIICMYSTVPVCNIVYYCAVGIHIISAVLFR